jgi:hypothetical protein
MSDAMPGSGLREGIIFKYGEGTIRRWLKVNTVGPISHLKTGRVRRLTAFDREGVLHRVTVSADTLYPVADEFPRRRTKPVPAAEFTAPEPVGD